MPNAAAHFDDDFDIAAPTRKKAPRRSAKPGSKAPGKRKKKGDPRFGFSFDTQRLARYGAVGMSVTIAVGIMVNALMMQKGHHPAPLFGKSIALGQSAEKAPAPPPPAIKKAEAVPAPVERAHADAQVPHDEDEVHSSDDAIGRLLQGGGASSAEKPSSKTVLGVQRALAKLGLTVKQTGTFGPQTRKAIEHFEKDHHLPVKGEMSRRVVKLLAAQSGIKIEP